MSIADATFYAVVYMQYGNNINPALQTTVILLSKYERSDVNNSLSDAIYLLCQGCNKVKAYVAISWDPSNHHLKLHEINLRTADKCKVLYKTFFYQEMLKC